MEEGARSHHSEEGPGANCESLIDCSPAAEIPGVHPMTVRGMVDAGGVNANSPILGAANGITGQRRDSLARKRYQKGSLTLTKNSRGKFWVAQWREDEIRQGQYRRVHCKQIIGSLKEFPTERLAQRELDRRLAEVNSPTYRAKPAANFDDFAIGWSEK
jgi:hypothetical protein